MIIALVGFIGGGVAYFLTGFILSAFPPDTTPLFKTVTALLVAFCVTVLLLVIANITISLTETLLTMCIGFIVSQLIWSATVKRFYGYEFKRMPRNERD